ncbi:hypothetical protein HN873_045793 [Arachis hypogaea]|nr:Thermospermine synthase [Arachis hypogaea]
MGGGEGSTARESLRHNTIDKVIMCDIDEVNYITVSMHVGIGDKLITLATELPSGGGFRDYNEVGLRELRSLRGLQWLRGLRWLRGCGRLGVLEFFVPFSIFSFREERRVGLEYVGNLGF